MKISWLEIFFAKVRWSRRQSKWIFFFLWKRIGHFLRQHFWAVRGGPNDDGKNKKKREFLVRAANDPVSPRQRKSEIQRRRITVKMQVENAKIRAKGLITGKY